MVADGVQFEGQKLTEIINSTHVNKKYLPDVKLPENVVAIPDIAEAVKGATAIVFVMPHQCEYLPLVAEPAWIALTSVLGKTLEGLEGKIEKGTKAISLIKVSPPRRLLHTHARRMRSS